MRTLRPEAGLVFRFSFYFLTLVFMQSLMVRFRISEIVCVIYKREGYI